MINLVSIIIIIINHNYVSNVDDHYPNIHLRSWPAPNMAAVPIEGAVSEDVFMDEITKEDIWPYFVKIDCSLRVLGSQFGIEPSKLTDLERRSGQALMDFRQLLLDECFKLEKITSWHQFVTVLEKPIVNEKSIAVDIRSRFNLSRQVSMDSATSSATTPMSPLQSLSSMEVSGSFSSTVGTKTGSKRHYAS